MGTNEKDMTAGSPGKLIITFAIPMMLGNIFQQFYTMADTMIVGQVVGVEALAAVGAGDWLVWLVLGIMTGITQGFSILVSQYYGAREKENLKCAVAKSYIMTALLSVVVLAVSEGTVYHVLLFLQTPDNVIDLTMLYLRLIFAGIPIIAAYAAMWEKYGRGIHAHEDAETGKELSSKLFMSDKKRPAWDLDYMMEIGFSKVFALKDISDISRTSMERELNKLTPQFLVGGEK